MYVKELSIRNYRNFGNEPFKLRLKPFTLLLGENNIGKTNLLNAVALLFSQEIGVVQRRVLDLDDLNCTTVKKFKLHVADPTIDAAAIAFPEVVIDALLTDFDDDQASVVGDWFTGTALDTAQVTYRFAPRASFNRKAWLKEQREQLQKFELMVKDPDQQTQNRICGQVPFPIGEYRHTIYGGNVPSNECNSYHLKMLRVEILDALRDASKELVGGSGQRLLYRVLRQGADDKYVAIRKYLAGLEECIREDSSLAQLKTQVEGLLDRMSLKSGPNENNIDFQFNSPDASELLKEIGMVYGSDPVNVARNGLGRNNLLYLSLVLSQLAAGAYSSGEGGNTYFRFVGIEEPEAHLHPHLQDHLASNIEAIQKQQDKKMQLILTSHSTHIAAKLKLESTAVLFRQPEGTLSAHYILDGLDAKKEADSIRFLSLYLDATKSRMFFARRLLLVEGIAEEVLVPRLFEVHRKESLEKAGISIVNVHGVAFKHFLAMVENGYFLRCAVLTDKDSGKKTEFRATELQEKYRDSDVIAVCISKCSTFEKDLIEANRCDTGKQLLLEALERTKPIAWKQFAQETGEDELDSDGFFAEIEDYKAEFAFNLTERLKETGSKLKVPDYLATAFSFLE